MANPELSQAKQQGRYTSQPPPLPMRHLSQPHKPQETPNPGHASPTTPVSLDPQQQPKLTSDSTRGCHASADARPPTSDRVAEFRLDIPDGIRNMTQHAGAQIHGSVLLTVTKATRAQRIQVRFLGRQRSQLQDAGSQSPIASFVTVELPLFDRQLTLWGGDADGAGAGVLEPGTLRLPFTVALPEAEYPATVRREGVCRVKYSLWAEFERQSMFCDRVLKTPKEEIWMSPRVYPGGGPSEKPLRIDAEAVPRVESGIVVRVAGAMSQSPVVAGGCVGLHLEASTAVGGGSGVEPGRYTVQGGRAVVVERMDVRGLIRGFEQSQFHRTDIWAQPLKPVQPDSAPANNAAKRTEPSAVFTSNGSLRIPVELCPFESKQLQCRYEMRLEFDIVDSRSLLDKVTRQSHLYSVVVPMDVCTAPAGVRLPWWFEGPAEPGVRAGGWDVERAFVAWDRNNPTWVALAEKRKRTPMV
ncbi:hypothetical protein LPJ66_004230 [Kickxella alabastrina]|uniref:Uncharacterized protein n=1 Tax=Kickxella alabastrina TaxID=61397 RepID=A0ACC1IIJ3_9FUNG|nr:hypothetical protein LPJ66_004230 [Kickxella alabastrina]